MEQGSIGRWQADEREDRGGGRLGGERGVVEVVAKGRAVAVVGVLSADSGALVFIEVAHPAIVRDVGRERVVYCDVDGPTIDSKRCATDLIGDALGERATLLAVPVALLASAFFQLRSGFAGAVTKKGVNYRLKLAVIGDIDDHLAASGALRDWVRECALATRLDGGDGPR